MSSYIFKGRVTHKRLFPKEYGFGYPYCGLAFDPRKLESLEFWPILSAVRPAFLRINPADYLDTSNSNFKEKLKKISPDLTTLDDIQIIALTMPKVLGYVFNPVTFYVFYDATLKVVKLLCEVSNTFGERFLYVLENVLRSTDSTSTFNFPKEFYVSPFFKTSGSYQIQIHLPSSSSFALKLKLSEANADIFFAELVGELKRLTLLSLVTYSPFLVGSACLAMLRIHIQALILFFKVGARYQDKPTTYSKELLRKFTSFVELARLFILKKLMSSK